MPEQAAVIYLVINLPSAEERREAILAQAEELGIVVQLVPAISGAELTAEQLSCYDEAFLQRYYSYKLTANEIACTLSHRKALDTFLEGGADYAVVLEDDAKLAPHFCEGVRELTQRLRGWEVAKLNIPAHRSRPIPLPPAEMQGATISPVFCTRIGSEAVGFVYTRHAACVIREALESFYLPADSMIGQIILDKQLPAIALQPQLVIQEAPGGLSTIDAHNSSQRAVSGRRSLAQYLRHRIRTWANNLRRRRLYRAVRRRVHRTA